MRSKLLIIISALVITEMIILVVFQLNDNRLFGKLDNVILIKNSGSSNGTETMIPATLGQGRTHPGRSG